MKEYFVLGFIWAISCRYTFSCIVPWILKHALKVIVYFSIWFVTWAVLAAQTDWMESFCMRAWRWKTAWKAGLFKKPARVFAQREAGQAVCCHCMHKSLWKDPHKIKRPLLLVCSVKCGWKYSKTSSRFPTHIHVLWCAINTLTDFKT